MKCERLFFVIRLASVFLLATVGLEADAGDARKALEKKGYTYTESSFIECAKNGDIEAAKMFLAEGININACNEKGQSALMNASLWGQAEMVALLLENGADVNLKSTDTLNTALTEAVSAQHPNIIRLLTQNGADLNAGDALNRTPLHTASMWDAAEVARVLIELGAKTDARDMMDNTPMMVAEQNGSTKVLELLKAAGVKE
jgi:ankyrin repeat protein